MVRSSSGRAVRSAVAVVVLTFLAIGLASASPETPAEKSGTRWTPLLSDLHTGAQILAIIVAGIFAYYKFFRGRTFYPRLEPALEASVIEVGPLKYLKTKARVKNVGLSKVPIDKDASALLVYRAEKRLSATGVRPVDWQLNHAVDVLVYHRWVEPGETIEDNWLFATSSSEEPVAFKVELKLAGGKTDWYANAVVETPDKPAPGILERLTSPLLERLLPLTQGGSVNMNDEPLQRNVEALDNDLDKTAQVERNKARDEQIRKEKEKYRKEKEATEQRE